MFYKITIYWRFVYLSNLGELGKKRKIVKIDNIGLFVYYEEESELTDENIRRHLIGREQKTIVIEGTDAKNSVEKFYQEFAGAKIGGEEEEEKALWINRNEPILELPNCKLIHQNKNGEYTCGKPKKDGAGEYGMCVLENYDPPENCPINLFYIIKYSKDSSNAFTVKKFLLNEKEYSVKKPNGFYNRIKRSYADKGYS